MFKSILVALVCAVTGFISGCGGGGGGGGASADPVSISVSRQSVAVAGVAYGTTPSDSVSMTPDHVPSGGLYVRGSYTAHGLRSAELFINANVITVNFLFRPPATLGAGVYTDTVSMQVCRDSACTQQVTNSPQQFTITYTVTANGAVGAAPALSTLSPATATANGSDFLMTLTGTGFDQSTQVYLDGVAKSTTYVSATQLWVQIQKSDIPETGAYSVLVTKSSTSSAPSNARALTVLNPALSLSKLSPTSVIAGSAAFTQTVIGTGFSSLSTVLWNGSARPTTFVSATELLAQISATDVATVGSASVTVAGAGSSVSSGQAVNIVAPSIEATAFQVNAQHSGVANFANIIAPSAFPLSSKWIASLNGEASYGLVAGGRVFATAKLSGGGSELYAFSAATGATLWGPISIPYTANATYDNGRVFVLSGSNFTSGTLFAYDAATGTQLWSLALTSQSYFTGPPTAGNGMVYVNGSGNNGGTLYAVDQTNGSVVWIQQVDSGGSSPSITADGVYMSYPCNVYSFRPLTGELVWRWNKGCSGGGDGTTGLLANGTFYSPSSIYTYDGVSIDARTGAFNSLYYATVPPAVGTQVGYFVQSGVLRAIRLSDSSVQWSFSGDGALTRPPILVNNYVFVLSGMANLYALDSTTGSLLWQTNLGIGMASRLQMPMSGLSAGGGLLIVPSGNTLVAYTLSNNP